MKKTLLLLLLFTGFIQSAKAQWFGRERITNLENFDKRPISWGYFLGFNSYDFKFEYHEDLGDNPNTDIQVNKQFGFNVGLIGDLRINEYLNLRLEPGLYYTQRDLIFPGFEEERDYLREVQSAYIHIPLLLKVSTKRINNFKPFITGGISTAINLSNNSENPDDNNEGEFRMEKNPLFYELGFGIDFYLPYFKFTPSIRGVFALKNELVPDDDPNSPWTSNIHSMESRAIFINFTFQ
ncbi:MAG TPA: porin family protein [Flavobacteriaceae bacterium]|nr:porin family protein [Flavobacteriaceae bacterium]